jgi:sortase A
MQPDHRKTTNDEARAQSERAAEAMRQKIAAIYAKEPSAREEMAEVKMESGRLSKHQAYMQELATSGKSLAEIQTAWHTYYTKLPDNEKHAVWREFYAAHGQAAQYPKTNATATSSSHIGIMPEPAKPRKTRTVADIKKQIAHHASGRGRLKARHHFQSLLFGLATGSLVILILLFGLFNERFIAPFITPSRNVNATPIISDPNSTTTSKTSEIIIPKINVEIPVVYDEPSIDEGAMQLALERGVVHYATTPNPGELGNAVIFGHSSNNIFNKGKYKFAFVLLSRLETGDLFYLDKDGKRYVYQVFSKKIVDPSDVSVLNKTALPATATLITCDPPGTSLHRLVVVGKQISPNPVKNRASHINGQPQKPQTLPSNSPSLWSRIVNWF